MPDEEMSLGEIGRTVLRIESNMVTKDGYGEVITGLREADIRNAKATADLAEKFDGAEKSIKSAGTARINIWIAAALALLGSAAIRLWPGP